MGHQFLLTAIAPAILFGAGAQRPEQTQPVRQSNLAEPPRLELVPTIAFTNTIPNMQGPEDDEQVFNSAEIYLIDPDGSNPRRLTNNQALDVLGRTRPRTAQRRPR